jgi:hypothetical protein
MDAQVPSNPKTVRRTQREDDAQFKVNLLMAYFESGRQELISRISQRDNAVLLFLAAATTIFGVAFGNVTRPAILFAISPLGLGAAVVYTQHNTLIGQLGYYCGVEVTEQAEEILGNSRCPDSWETSKSLFDPTPTGVTSRSHDLDDPEATGATDGSQGLMNRLAQVGRALWGRLVGLQPPLGIPWVYVYRLLAILLLIPIPGIAGAIIGFNSTPNPQWVHVCGLIIGVLTAVWAAVLLFVSIWQRTKLLNEVAEWRRNR